MDAVNIVDADIAVITTIDLDHTDWLGPTRASIAEEKAGIFRAHRPVVCGDPDPPANLRERADWMLNSSWHALNSEFFYHSTGRVILGNGRRINDNYQELTTHYVKTSKCSNEFNGRRTVAKKTYPFLNRPSMQGLRQPT